MTPSTQHQALTTHSTNEPLPPLVPLLQRILDTASPAFQNELAEIARDDGAALRAALFPVTGEYVYLNHAGVGPFPATVTHALRHAADSVSRQGSHAMTSRFPEVDARQRFGRLINVPPESIAFTKNVSDAFVTIAQGLDWRPGDNIVTVQGEFPANVYPWLNLAEHGVETRFVPTQHGRFTLDEMAERIDERTRLVSLSFVQFGSGMRADVAGVARLAHARGALCAVDGIQGLGALRLDATAADLDFVASGSAKWLLSPAHVGLLYVKPALLPTLRVARRGWQSFTTPYSFFDYQQPLRDDAGRLEGGSNSWLSIAALDAALALLEANDAAIIEQRVLGLAERMRSGLADRGYVMTSPDAPEERSPILTFHWREDDPAAADALVERLETEAKIVISARNGLLRASPHFYNTDDDIQRFLEQLDAYA